MKKFYSLFFLFNILIFTNVGWGQGTENFTNLPANSSSYTARTWTGTDGVVWNATAARTDQTFNGRAICLKDGTAGIVSPTYSGGIGTLQFNYVRGFTGTNARSLLVYVNSVLKATITVNATSSTPASFSQAINISGNVIVEIKAGGSAQIIVDDISWNAYSDNAPIINTSVASLTNFGTVTVGSNSGTPQSYTVSGSFLTHDIVITPPVDFEISTSEASGFSTNAITLTQVSGVVPVTTIYVRFTPLSAGTKSGNITHVSTDASTNNVSVNGVGANQPLYFQSKASGNGSDPATWETSSDQSVWVNATAAPISTDYIISIRSGHTVTINSATSIDQVIVENGGILSVNGSLTVNNGTGDDIIVQNGGKIIYTGGPTYSSSTIRINTGGVLSIQSSGITGSGAGVNSIAHIYDNGSILEWNLPTSTPSSSGVTYFPNVDANTIPIFRFASIINGNLGAGSPTVVNGIFEVSGGVTINFAGASTKTFRNGIRGEGTINQGAASQFIINGNTAEIGGTGTITLGSGGLALNSPSTILTSNKKIDGGTVLVNGLLNCQNFVLSGTSALTVSSGASLKIDSPEGITLAGAAGNIQVDGARTFDANAVYEYNGTAAQNTGNGLPSSISGTLKINNPLGVTLDQATTVTGILNLASGTLATSATNLLTLGSAIVLTGGTSGSYVSGPLAHTFIAIGSRIFPIGKGSMFRPLTVDLTNLTGSGTITAEQFNTIPTGNIEDLSFDGISQVRYFSVNTTGITAADANITLSWGADDDVSDLTNITVVNGHNTVAWVHQSNISTTGNSSSGTVTGFFSDPFIGDFTLGNITGGTNVLPVELSSFTAFEQNKNMKLVWQTSTEVNNDGFDVERSNDNKSWTKLGFVQGNGYSNSTKDYSFTDKTISAAGKYNYRLKQIDKDGAFKYSNSIEVDFSKPVCYGMDQNFPNPFNPSTVIAYTIPEASNVKLVVYNAIGQNVKVLENGFREAGAYKTSFNASELPSGIYFYRLDAGSFSQIKKMLLVK